MEKKSEIIQAALQVFSVEGFNGASLSKIAELAGTNKQLINHHFGSKRNLWQEVVDHELQDGVELIRRVREVERSDGPLPALIQFIEEYVVWVSTKTAFQMLMLFEGQQETERVEWFKREHFLPSAKTVMRLISSCQDIGAVKQGDAGMLYFTALHMGNAPFISAVQYRLMVKQDPMSEAEISHQQAQIFDYLGLSGSRSSIRMAKAENASHLAVG
ncbi:MAG: TetR/AcrR family transcriptional regulator [Erythrobacter sp.]